MAKDQFSFDIVSEVDMQEIRNAVDQASREISQRFDFKGTGTSVALEATRSRWPPAPRIVSRPRGRCSRRRPCAARCR